MSKRRSKTAQKVARQKADARARKARMEPTESTAKRATWSGLLVESGTELQDFLPVDEPGYLMVAGTSHADARAYFAYSVADEVLATGSAIFRWLRLLEDMEKPEQESARWWTQSILDEQHGRVRKLVEMLLDLICFRETNEDPYYRHLMLLHELNGARGTEQDLREFYACPNRNIHAQVERVAKQVAELEASGDVDLARCWYLKGVSAPRAAEQLSSMQPGQYLASARARLQKALVGADDREKLALGLSYDRLYSRTSRHIHFSPASKDNTDVEDVAVATDQCGILGLDVVVALQRLLDEVPGTNNERVRRLMEDNPYPTQLSEQMSKGTAKVGDFVLAYGDLAEVLDTAESRYGYRSYKVLYLAGSPMPAINEDWFPAEFVRVMLSREGIELAVLQAVEDGSVPKALADSLLAAEGRDAFRQSAAAVWENGLREHVLRRRTSTAE